MSLKKLFALACAVGLFLSISNLFGWTFHLNQVTSNGLDWTTVIDPKHHSTIYIVLGVILMVSAGIMWIESNFSFTGGLLCAVSIISLFSGIGRLHLYDPEGPIWIEGLIALLYLTLIALTVKLKLPKNAVGTGIFLLLLLPLSGNAQGFIEADAQYGENGLWPRATVHLHVPSEGQVRFLTVAEFGYQEALLMQGITWETALGEVGFTAGAFIEPAENQEELAEGPTMLGVGAMAIYSLEQNQFHILLEAGPGYNFHEVVPLYDFRMWYLAEDWLLGTRVHYELGIGPTLGYQLAEHWQINTAGFWSPDKHLTGLLGLAYCIGGNHH